MKDKSTKLPAKKAAKSSKKTAKPRPSATDGAGRLKKLKDMDPELRRNVSLSICEDGEKIQRGIREVFGDKAHTGTVDVILLLQKYDHHDGTDEPTAMLHMRYSDLEDGLDEVLKRQLMVLKGTSSAPSLEDFKHEKTNTT